MKRYAVGYPVKVKSRQILAQHGWPLPPYEGDGLRPCGACGERLLLTAGSLRTVLERGLLLLCPFCAEDRRVTRPMTSGERRIMLGE